MRDYRLFLCGITSAGNEANLRAMIDPISEHLSGLQFCFHYPTDAGADYLESQKGDGRIVYSYWHQRHGVSMSQFLWQGTMEAGDFFLVLDSMERLSPQFCYQRLPGLIALMKEANVAMIANYGKGLLFRYNEQLEFRGSPHWYAQFLDGSAINMEFDKSEFWNVRGEQRNEYQWVAHYCRYYLYPEGSNHCLLGLEKQGDPQKLFPIREARRVAFRRLMRTRGYPITEDGIKDMLSQPLDEEVKGYLNAEKILSDWYRYHILGDKTVVHSHLPSDMKHIA